MFEDTLELAENKLLLLYILDKIKIPISNMQLTEIILANNLMNYFTLQQYIAELISSKFLESIEKNTKQRLLITEKGTKVLTLFGNRLLPSKLDVISNYLKKHIENIKKEIALIADYTIENNNSFIVNLKVTENDTILMDLKVNVASNKQARDLCNKWKDDCVNLYNSIMNILIDE